MKYSICNNAYGREVERVLYKFADAIGELQNRPNYAVLRSLANAVDGAAAEIGLPKSEPVALVDMSTITPEDFENA